MVNEDNLIGTVIYPTGTNKETNSYTIIAHNKIQNISGNIHEGYSIKSMLGYINSKAWTIISQPNQIHELWN